MDPALPFAQAHAVATELEDRLREAFAAAAADAANGQPIADINIHIEPRSREMHVGHDLPRRDASRYAVRLGALGGEIPRVRGGLGVAVLSTSEGIMTGVQARKKNLGGEVVCYVW